MTDDDVVRIEVGDGRAVVVRPGDFLVITFPGLIGTAEDLDQFVEDLKAGLPESLRGRVLVTESVNVDVARPVTGGERKVAER